MRPDDEDDEYRINNLRLFSKQYSNKFLLKFSATLCVFTIHLKLKSCNLGKKLNSVSR